MLGFASFPVAAEASITLKYNFNRTGKGTDSPKYKGTRMYGRYKGEVLFVNDGDPCIYYEMMVNNLEKGWHSARKDCMDKEEDARNPVMRMGISIPGDRNRVQAKGPEPICELPARGKSGPQWRQECPEYLD